ncbi:MAG: tRNA epoxyqueuosine(34) reductase QueG [Pseudomonadota bacterium]
MLEKTAIETKLRAEAMSLGFSDMAVADPGGIEAAGEKLALWLDADRHGDMTWMADRAHWRADPRALWPEVRSVIVLVDRYGPDLDPLTLLERRDRAAISCYAWGKDYHDTIKKRMKRLGRWLINEAGGDIKVFVDTAPVMEKPLAAAAGLGWQGKHTNLVSRDLGSWFFIGAIFTTLDLAKDKPHEERCGTCRSCIDICPTAAFPAPFQLDASRCISYLTIELKGSIPREMRPLIGNRIYGCDDCLAVCPWNKFAARAYDPYLPKDGMIAPALTDLASLSDQAFRARFSGSSIKRIGRERFLRNVAVAIGNSGQRKLVGTARTLAADSSPLIREHAVWALSRLMRAEDFLALPTNDPDPTVRQEYASCREELTGRLPSFAG